MPTIQIHVYATGCWMDQGSDGTAGVLVAEQLRSASLSEVVGFHSATVRNGSAW